MITIQRTPEQDLVHSKLVRIRDRFDPLYIMVNDKALCLIEVETKDNGKPGCMSCYFSSSIDFSARNCPYNDACMAHCRPDKRSVYFKRRII